MRRQRDCQPDRLGETIEHVGAKRSFTFEEIAEDRA